MSTKRVLLVILVASTTLLTVGAGPRIAGTVRALPPASWAGGVTLPYPGRLEDDTGQPVADGAYDFRFALYTAAQGGEPLWSEVQRGVAVRDGAFLASLGSASPIPDGIQALDAERPTRWLAVAVRGPGETEFTALTPRQQLSAAAPTALNSATAGLACPHDHFGESWNGVSVLPGLEVINSSSGAAGLRGWSTSGVGVQGLGSPWAVPIPVENHGVWGYSWSEHGVYGKTNGDWGWRSGVYGEAIKDHANGVTGWNTAGGTGVYGYSETGDAGDFRGRVRIRGRSTSSANETLRVEDSDQEMGLSVRDDGSVVIGALSGSASAHICSRIESADARNVLAICSSAAEYVPTVDNGLGFPEAGDLVSIVPQVGDPYSDDHAPFAVTKATSAYNPNLVGFISDPELGADGWKLNDHYLPLAIYGYFPVKVTMHNGPIRQGDPITSSPQPGYGMKATEPGRIVGYALEDADEEGTIRVVVQVGDHLGDAPERIDRLEAEVLAMQQERESLLQQYAGLEARLTAMEALVDGDAGKEGGQ